MGSEESIWDEGSQSLWQRVGFDPHGELSRSCLVPGSVQCCVENEPAGRQLQERLLMERGQVVRTVRFGTIV